MQTDAAILLGVAAFGLLHGVNPSHGWTVAVLYSIRHERPLLSSITSSGIISGAHFLSSMVVVLAYVLLTSFIQIPHTYLNYAVATALGILAYIFWKEKSEDLIVTQHGHLHEEAVEHVEHEHAHWHKDGGYHTHLHVHQNQVEMLQFRELDELGAVKISKGTAALIRKVGARDHEGGAR